MSTENTEKQWRILVVDDEPNNLQLLRQLLKNQYHISLATSGHQALEVAEKVKPDLILLDIMMPGIDGYETCTQFKSNPETAAIPVIFVSAKSEVLDERRGFDVGAVDYITKPVSGPIVHARIATHLALYDQQRTFETLLLQRTKELAESQKAAIHMLGEAGHYNDEDTGVHIWRMAAYAEAIARKAGWHVKKARQLQFAAPMHDTGKIGIPDAILKKPGKLTPEEWVIMRKHTEIGYGILVKSDTPLFKMAADISLYHHEKWDGSGYPQGLSGERIPESARIVALADVFDALTMERPYKKAWSVEEAFAEIERCRGQHFDPVLTDHFLEIKDEILAIKDTWDTAEAKMRESGQTFLTV
ncbi:response regulator [Paraneptunicella aestuarii]|uniref:HD domain-containing phosphohydrolase n=1 Tax=Paraneptunicella aestuarii TaxID=2831148 RepID=UPI001E39FA04|nr:HD domain-containing phosphohydrolase [Paraneptunicella aestuarii]UAA37828.1 response regulator [Paraneptunicella aestuarii]